MTTPPPLPPPAAVSPVAPQRPAEDVDFRAMNRAQYEALDPRTKDSLVKARHAGIMRAAEQQLDARLRAALAQPVVDPATGQAAGPPPTLDQLVALMMDREDPACPPELRAALERSNLEVLVDVVLRAPFVAGVAGLTFEGRQPYREAARALAQPPPPQTVYFAVFSAGICTVTLVGFDPAAPPGAVLTVPGPGAPPAGP